MSKYRKGSMYLRHLKSTDKANDMRTALRLATFSEPEYWSHPKRVKPVVMVQHGVEGVAGVWLNKEDAISSFLTRSAKRRRNAKHNVERGQRMTKGDLRKAFRAWAFKHG
ncbi:hypothetical protein [Hafnia paralvei]|uniref:hypothetical protein n=1 Tax=Hafnia paralvei TaxID=546367 RepID=UPI0018F0DCE7|nr:hypothetical protein [Hafnia paralvei]MBW2958929.1 hypothetical protein [Hafnia paralvei]